MFRPIFISVILAAALLLSSCKDEVTGGNNDNLLKGKSSGDFTGTWVLKQYEDTSVVMVRRDKLADDNYGFIFKTDGVFIERKNNSWCGTPPVVYADYEGTWEAESDSVIRITVGYWGGTLEHNLVITELNENEIKYYVTVKK